MIKLQMRILFLYYIIRFHGVTCRALRGGCATVLDETHESMIPKLLIRMNKRLKQNGITNSRRVGERMVKGDRQISALQLPQRALWVERSNPHIIFNGGAFSSYHTSPTAFSSRGRCSPHFIFMIY
ncbi:hypothetical protein M569_00040 [Genlisea aurea]|uniref:Secreted protein n=1 Tax=Genlisea aurea TaxID=192259 RepID=S8D5L3_9LAMI|nr:hypothetical protein M569_00040 [Genlisea aurea]